MKRRRLLASVGAVAMGCGAVLGTGGFATVEADRGASVSVATGANAALGIVGQGPAKKNERAPMVEYTNNTGQTITITTTLVTTGDITLYNNTGDSGSTVTIVLDPTNSASIDIESKVTGTVQYTVSVTSQGMDIEANGSVEVQSGQSATAVRIKKPSKNDHFAVNASSFEVTSADIVDIQSPDNLDIVEFRVREGGSNGSLVGSKDIDNPPSDRYFLQGNQTLPIDPQSGYTIQSNTTYTLTVTAYDAEGNSASETVENTL